MSICRLGYTYKMTSPLRLHDLALCHLPTSSSSNTGSKTFRCFMFKYPRDSEDLGPSLEPGK